MGTSDEFPADDEDAPGPRAGNGDSPEADDRPLSLEDLGRAYAELMGRREAAEGDDEDSAPPEEAARRDPDPADWQASVEAPAAEDESDDKTAEVTPRGILEAMLFVGNPANEPLTSSHVATLLRGVSSEEVEELIHELNAEYDADGCPFTIGSFGPGYRLVLRDEYGPLRAKFYGRMKEARLSQAAIDVLAIVGYNQPVTRDEVDRLRGKPSGPLLAQLVRRRLLRIERLEGSPRTPRYLTTERFLVLFGLGSLDEMPKSEDLDRAT